MDIKFFCGVNETVWNRHPVEPGLSACVAPVYGKSERTRCENRVMIPAGCEVLQDSGAFSDSVAARLSFEAAYRRQLDHAEKFGYDVAYRASYDLLIDEVWTGGNRSKRRWSVADAASAVDETVKAAEWIAERRDGIPLVLSAQGVTPEQYLDCVKRIVPVFRDGDIFGLGGWCIIGKLPASMLPVFRDTVRIVIPYLASQGVKAVHVWGVCYAPALAALLIAAQSFGMQVSTDSAGPSVRPAFGEWGYAEWRDNNYQRPSVDVRGLERARHVAATREWLARFGSTVHCSSRQLRLI
jgi:hypothetical protein